MNDEVYEKLGVFYLGREISGTAPSPTTPLLYDSRDLTTHAMVVGMTGSGKTGLCVDLLEEAGIDGIPAIVIDPKGDIANLALMFPNMKAEDFLPWVEKSEATRHGMTELEFAQREAEKWSQGLQQWDQSPARIQRFQSAVDLTIYTPGSTAGRPLTMLRSFAAPPAELIDDTELFSDRISSAASGLLGLMGIQADPIRSREHILLSKILEHWWRSGRDLSLGQLIVEIQNPPFEKVGVLDLAVFYPTADRLELAMSLNHLLASPAFATWLEGEPLNIQNLLYSATGRPRVSIISIAHLSDAERMFFVTLLLNEMVAWTRLQSGTSSLRAILYMDEVFGFFPPVASPPSKRPMLTLLKQARAYGLGVVLATQNPADLDYKGLANMGTWFLGRLQTERDKQRIMEGLEGAATATGVSFSAAETSQILSDLKPRQFLMRNVHDDHPVLMETRWALSYLRGPLTRNQIASLHQQQQANNPQEPPREMLDTAALTGTDQVLLPAGIQPKFARAQKRLAAGQRLVYRPALVATGRLHFVKASSKTDLWEQRCYHVLLSDQPGSDLWSAAIRHEDLELEIDAMASDVEYAPLPSAVSDSKNFARWTKQFESFLYRQERLIRYRCVALKCYSEDGESERDFRVRLKQLLAEERDLEKEKLRKKFQSRFQTLENKIRRAEEKIEREKSQYSQKKWDSILSVGTTILGAFMGRKTVSVTNMRRAESSMKGMSKVASERADVEHAEENLETLLQHKEELEADFQQEVAALEKSLQAETVELETQEISPRKSDLSVVSLDLTWMPFQVDASGIAEPLFPMPM